MVVVLGYNKSENVFLNEELRKNKIDFKYSLLESKILNAEKIILPNPENFNTTYRKLNMMNLFSLLRMVKKPILGINNGFKFMCNQITDTCKNGLGFFDVDVESENGFEDQSDFKVGKLSFNDNTILLDQSFEQSEVFFNSKTQPKICPNTCLKIYYLEENYSLVLGSEKKYAMYLNVEQNKKLASEIIKNFLLI